MSQLGGGGDLPIDLPSGGAPTTPAPPQPGALGDGVVHCRIVAVRQSGTIVGDLASALPSGFTAPASQITYDIQFWPNQGRSGTFFGLTPDQHRQSAVDIHPARPGNAVPGFVEGGVLKFTCVEPEKFEECPP